MMWRVETHCHSHYSNDSLSKPEDIIRVAKQRRLDKVILTDHNTIQGALVAKEIDPDLIIIGEEVLTTEGEFLAFFVQEEVPRGLKPMEALERLKDQNAFISVSHPFDYLRKGWSLETLTQIKPHIDAIEIFNARSFSKGINQQAQTYADKNDLAGTVGSDAHLLIEVGRVSLQLPPFENTDQLRQVIRQGQFVERYSSPLVRFGSTYAKIVHQILKG